MRNLENMLKNKAIECNRLVEYGFKKQENKYIFKNKIYNKQFEIVVIISDKQKTSKLIDLANDEEYIMVDIQDCAGKFVGEIRQEYEKTIQDIINKCTIDEIYKNQQSKEVIRYIKEKYDDDLLSQKVYDYLTTIPKGKVVTYKQIGDFLGNKGLARAIGNILHKNPDGDKYPCYKVLNSKGELAEAFVFGGKDIQRKRLEKDGIKVVNNKVDLKIYQWKQN